MKTTVLGSRVFLSFFMPLMIVVVAAGLVMSTLRWSAVESDAVSVMRQQDLVNLVISKLQQRVAHDQESVTVWDEAVVKASQPDPTWIDLNLGSWMHSYFQHDVLIVLDAQGEPIYHFFAESAGRIPGPELFASYSRLVKRLKERLIAGDETGVTEQVLTIGESDLAVLAGRPAVVSVKPIVSDTGKFVQEPGRENLHVSIRFVDGDFATVTGSEYQLKDLKFVWTPTDARARANAGLVARDGHILGYFSWTPFRPGTSVLSSTLPAVGFATAGIFAALSILGFTLWHRSSRLLASRAELHHATHHDGLTGLLNRAGLGASLKGETGTPVADNDYGVLLIDLDRFGEINDAYGHAICDELLILAGQRLSGILPEAIIGRIGGDEFIVILHDTDETRVAQAAAKIVDVLAEPMEINGHRVSMGASVGVALAAGESGIAEVRRQANIALFHAKAAGRGRFAVFGKHMDALLESRREMKHDLTQAVESKTQIEAFYQPVYAADTGVVTGVEALIRWRHPTKGLVGPDAFIPLAEELGLIHALGRIVLEQSCQVVADYPHFTVALNASSVELSSTSYPLHFLSTLSRFGVDPGKFEIEVTETAQLDETSAFSRNVAALRRAGVRFAIDDFGTGYSTFSRLEDLKVDRVKLDRSFVSDLGRRGSETVVEAIIAMAHAKGLKVTAEGVETAEQIRTLRALGCDTLQGFLLSRPLTRGQLDALSSRSPAIAWQ